MQRFFFFLLCFTVFVSIFSGCRSESVSIDSSQVRLISTTPSITEILFDIGAGTLLVGDSRFTAYPPEAAAVEKIGGLYDLNPEKLFSLKADLTFFLMENSTLQRQLEQWKIKGIAVDHRSIGGVLESYDIIGNALGGEFAENAAVRKKALQHQFTELQERNRNRLPVKVLVCVDRSRNIGRIENLFVAGNNPLYQDIITAAGGENVAAKTSFPFPSISPEGVIYLAPDVIIELFTGEGASSAMLLSEQERQHLVHGAKADWQMLGNSVPAVKNGRIFMILEDYATVPGPRTPMLIERVSELLYK